MRVVLEFPDETSCDSIALALRAARENFLVNPKSVGHLAFYADRGGIGKTAIPTIADIAGITIDELKKDVKAPTPSEPRPTWGVKAPERELCPHYWADTGLVCVREAGHLIGHLYATPSERAAMAARLSACGVFDPPPARAGYFPELEDAFIDLFARLYKVIKGATGVREIVVEGFLANKLGMGPASYITMGTPDGRCVKISRAVDQPKAKAPPAKHLLEEAILDFAIRLATLNRDDAVREIVVSSDVANELGMGFAPSLTMAIPQGRFKISREQAVQPKDPPTPIADDLRYLLRRAMKELATAQGNERLGAAWVASLSEQVAHLASACRSVSVLSPRAYIGGNPPWQVGG